MINQRLSAIKRSAVEPVQGNVKELFSNADGNSNAAGENDSNAAPPVAQSAPATTNSPAKVSPKVDAKATATPSTSGNKILGFIPEEHKWYYLLGAVVVGAGAYYGYKQGWFGGKH